MSQGFGRLTYTRCFLYLVNYARMRPEIAVKAIPLLEHVRLSSPFYE